MAGREEKEVFERLHGELVGEAGALAAACGADVAVSPHPRSGQPRVSSFPGAAAAGGPQRSGMRSLEEEIAGMGAAEVLACDERLRALRPAVLRQITEKEKKAAAATNR